MSGTWSTTDTMEMGQMGKAVATIRSKLLKKEGRKLELDLSQITPTAAETEIQLESAGQIPMSTKVVLRVSKVIRPTGSDKKKGSGEKKIGDEKGGGK